MELILIAGASGSGKTTLAKEIAFDKGNTLVINSDDYYKDMSGYTDEEKNDTNFDEPEAIDFKKIVEDINKLANGIEIDIYSYNYAACTRTPTEKKISPKGIDTVIVEGILVLTNADLRSMAEKTIFVDTDIETCMLRRKTRDLEERGKTLEKVESELKNVRAMYLKHVLPSRKYANTFITCDNTLETEEASCLTP